MNTFKVPKKDNRYVREPIHPIGNTLLLLDDSYGVENIIQFYENIVNVNSIPIHRIDEKLAIYRSRIIDGNLLLSVCPKENYENYIIADDIRLPCPKYNQFFRKKERSSIIYNVDTNICGIQSIFQILLKTRIFETTFLNNEYPDNRDLVYYIILLIYINVECEGKNKQSADDELKKICERIIILLKAEDTSKLPIYEALLSEIGTLSTVDTGELHGLYVSEYNRINLTDTKANRFSLPVEVVQKSKYITNRIYLFPDQKDNPIYITKGINYIKPAYLQMGKNYTHTLLTPYHLSQYKMNTYVLHLLYYILCPNDKEYFMQKDIENMYQFVGKIPFLENNCITINDYKTCNIDHKSILDGCDKDIVVIVHSDYILVENVPKDKSDCTIMNVGKSKKYNLLGICHRQAAEAGGHHIAYILNQNDDNLYKYDNMLKSSNSNTNFVQEKEKLLREADICIYEKKT